MIDFKRYVTETPDFPKAGILFRDFSPLLRHHLGATLEALGKLLSPVEQLSYQLEYGAATLEMHPGTGRLLLVDDILATGGTLGAAAQLCQRAGYDLRAILVLADLGLREGPIGGLPVRSLLQYRS